MDLPLMIAATADAEISLWLVLPFALLLLLIATLPLTPPRLKHFWEHYYPHVSIAFAVAMAAYYIARVPGGTVVLGHTLHDYASFVILIGSLFVVASGIHIKVKGE